MSRGLPYHPSRHRDADGEAAKDRWGGKSERLCFSVPLVRTACIALFGKLHSLSYSRDAESRADITGSDVCAATGSYNPWGLVWLFQDFQNADMGQVPQLLSDHPGNENRVSALKKHFRENPSVFGKFSSDPRTAKPISVPKDAGEVFLR